MSLIKRVHIKESRSLGSNSGLISLDFLFGFLLSLIFFMIFFALSYSLTVVEIVQYISFASARTYMAADLNESKQETNAKAKAASLIQTKFAPYFGNGNWFTVGSGKGLVKFLPSDASGQAVIGIQIPLTIHLLEMHFPYFGTTKATDSGEGFQTVVASYLIREPTQSECLSFNNNRANLLQALPPFNNLANFSTSVFRVTDNGC